MVLAAVTPAWKAMESVVSKLRVEVEPKIKEVVEPIGKAKLEVINKIKDAVMSVITPILKEHVAPHLTKIVEVIQSPMTEAFEESYKLYDSEFIEKFEPKESGELTKKEFSQLDYHPYSWKMWDVTRKADSMYEPLWALNILFSDIYPWGLIWTAHDVLRKKMDNAIYTYEQKLLEAQEKGEEKDVKALSHKLKHLILQDYQADGNLARVIYYRDIIKTIVMPAFNKLVYPACETLLSPLENAIPDPMKQFLDVNDMFERVCEGVIDDSISTVLGDAK